MDKYANLFAGIALAGFVAVAVVRGNGAKLVEELSEERSFLIAAGSWAVIGVGRGIVPQEALPVYDGVRNLAIVAALVLAAQSGNLNRAIQSISSVFGEQRP